MKTKLKKYTIPLIKNQIIKVNFIGDEDHKDMIDNNYIIYERSLIDEKIIDEYCDISIGSNTFYKSEFSRSNDKESFLEGQIRSIYATLGISEDEYDIDEDYQNDINELKDNGLRFVIIDTILEDNYIPKFQKENIFVNSFPKILYEEILYEQYDVLAKKFNSDIDSIKNLYLYFNRDDFSEEQLFVIDVKEKKVSMYTYLRNSDELKEMGE